MTGTIRAYFNEHPDHFDPRQYLKPARANIKALVEHKLKDVLGCALRDCKSQPRIFSALCSIVGVEAKKQIIAKSCRRLLSGTILMYGRSISEISEVILESDKSFKSFFYSAEGASDSA